MQKITPFLWFDTQAEEAAEFYVSIFKNSKIMGKTYYTDSGPGPAGTVLTVSFQLEGQQFVALNGGPLFTFSEAISFQVECQDQAEVDELWRRLTDGGEESMCGWLKDKFGLSWQITPRGLNEMLSSPDSEKAARATHAMLQMRKIDLAKIQGAYQGGGS